MPFAAAPEAELPENAKPLSEIVAGVQSKGYGPVVEIELGDDEWEILAAVEGQGYGPIIEVELGDDGWEIDALKDGEEVCLIADPETGEIRPADEG